ncbi:MAG: zinc ribbon domain-containing protein [Acidimicrobiales bacterium]
MSDGYPLRDRSAAERDTPVVLPERLADRLLELQAVDSELDALRLRRRSLPQRSGLTEAESAVSSAASDLRADEEKEAALARRVADLEGSTAQLSKRIEVLRERLYGPSPPPPRELAALEGELGSMLTRRDGQEEETISLMESAEALVADQPRQEEAARGAERRLGDAREALAAAEAAVDAEAVEMLHRRSALAGGVGRELLSRYDAIRKHLGGTAVARLEQRACSGCHLDLSATELDRIRRAPAGELSTCESCGRMLVRA